MKQIHKHNIIRLLVLIIGVIAIAGLIIWYFNMNIYTELFYPHAARATADSIMTSYPESISTSAGKIFNLEISVYNKLDAQVNSEPIILCNDNNLIKNIQSEEKSISPGSATFYSISVMTDPNFQKKAYPVYLCNITMSGELSYISKALVLKIN